MTARPENEVHIVEDDASLRGAIQRLLEEAGYLVQAHASAEDYLAAVRTEACHCLLLDVRLPGLSGVALQQKLLDTDASRAIIFMTGHGTIPAAVSAMQKGAVDYLSKPVEEESLLGAVEKALRHCREKGDDAASRRIAKARLDLLTPREKDVLRLVVLGLPNKAIAAGLNIALSTVKIHRGRVMDKMQADSVVNLVSLAELAGVPSGKDNP
jgi:two-component system, LuxR family, response regulator FixJ